MRRVSYYIILAADGMYADPDGGLGHYDPAEEEPLGGRPDREPATS